MRIFVWTFSYGRRIFGCRDHKKISKHLQRHGEAFGNGKGKGNCKGKGKGKGILCGNACGTQEFLARQIYRLFVLTEMFEAMRKDELIISQFCQKKTIFLIDDP